MKDEVINILRAANRDIPGFVLTGENLPRGCSRRSLIEIAQKGYLIGRSMPPDSYGATVAYRITDTGKKILEEEAT